MTGVVTNPVPRSELLFSVTLIRWKQGAIFSSRFAHTKRRRKTTYLPVYLANEELTEHVDFSLGLGSK